MRAHRAGGRAAAGWKWRAIAGRRPRSRLGVIDGPLFGTPAIGAAPPEVSARYCEWDLCHPLTRRQDLALAAKRANEARRLRVEARGSAVPGGRVESNASSRTRD